MSQYPKTSGKIVFKSYFVMTYLFLNEQGKISKIGYKPRPIRPWYRDRSILSFIVIILYFVINALYNFSKNSIK